MNVKRMVGFAIVLALGVALGAVLFGPADVALGQDNAERFVLRFPPSPCRMEMQSRVINEADGTASARLVAFPPNPCVLPYFAVKILAESVPETSANCVEFGQLDGASMMQCEFTSEHELTTFEVQPIGRRASLE